MQHRFIVTLLAGLTLAGCEIECPPGSTKVGERCLAPDQLAMLDGGSGDGSTGGNDGSTTGGPTDFTVTIENTGTAFEFPASGVFDTPEGETMPGPIKAPPVGMAMPGGSYSWTFKAASGYPGRMGETKLSFATMLVASNDLFFAPGPEGIPLFPDKDADGNPIPIGKADPVQVTDQVMIWDAGTEENNGLGAVANSPTGMPSGGGAPDSESNNVRPAKDAMAFMSIADANAFIQVTIKSEVPDVPMNPEDRETVFTVTLTNKSTDLSPADSAKQVSTPVSPGVWVVHTEDGPLFTPGMPNPGDGLQALAEDGMTDTLAADLDGKTGLIAVSSPGVWAVHDGADPFFTAGDEDRGDGLEALAEDGIINEPLKMALSSQSGIKSSGTVGTMPFGPTGMVTFDLSAEPGDRFSFVTMAVPSNDLLFTFDGQGVELFNGSTPISGAVSKPVEVWDAGTEVDQEPGVGLDQVHLQPPEGNTGDDDSNTEVRKVTDSGFDPSVIKVSVTPR